MDTFQEVVLKPVIDFIVKKAKEVEGVATDKAKLEQFIISHLESFLKSFTHATTHPTDYMSDNIDSINAMINKSTGSDKPKSNI